MTIHAPAFSADRLVDGEIGPRPQPLVLRAGPLTMEWEVGGLRYIKLGDHEIVRRVYAAVRDANWGTVPDEISNVAVTAATGGFELSYDVRCRQNEIDFSWRATILGTASGRVEFVMEGIARSTFQRNRIGFCILHPMELAGTEVEVTHADGSRQRSEFPRFIAPENPFKDLVGLRHAAGPDADVQITCSGDIFESEDQRNWSDASYKTFCTPLSRPFPVLVNAGERVSQRIVVEVMPKPGRLLPAGVAERDERVELQIANNSIARLPKLGFAIGVPVPELTKRDVERLRRLRPAHVQFEIRLPGFNEQAVLRAAAVAAELQTELDLVLYLGDGGDCEVDALLACLREAGAKVARCTLFPQGGWWTTRELVERYSARLKQWSQEVPIGGGTPASFCELNRHRPPTDLLDFVTWSMQPQEHAFDNRSLMETLAAQGAIVESSRQFCGELPLVVGPITLKKRINPVATTAWPPKPVAGELPVQVDARQATLFGAAWTLGNIKYLAETGVSAATYYELVGWKGLIERAEGSPLPERFASAPGGVLPLYHVFADLADYADSYVVPVKSAAPLNVEAMAVARKPHGRVDCILIANLSASEQSVIVPVAQRSAEVRVMGGGNTVDAVESPVTFRQYGCDLAVREGRLEVDLPPYAVCRVKLR